MYNEQAGEVESSVRFDMAISCPIARSDGGRRDKLEGFRSPVLTWWTFTITLCDQRWLSLRREGDFREDE